MVGVGRETTHTVSPRTRPRRAKVAALISRVFRLTNLQNVPYRAPLAEETLVCMCVCVCVYVSTSCEGNFGLFSGEEE